MRISVRSFRRIQPNEYFPAPDCSLCSIPAFPITPPWSFTFSHNPRRLIGRSLPMRRAPWIVTAKGYRREAHHIKSTLGSGRLSVEQKPLFRGPKVFSTLTVALAASCEAQRMAESKGSYRKRTGQDHGGNSNYGRDTHTAQARDSAGSRRLCGLFQSPSWLVLLLGKCRPGRS